MPEEVWEVIKEQTSAAMDQLAMDQIRRQREQQQKNERTEEFDIRTEPSELGDFGHLSSEAELDMCPEASSSVASSNSQGVPVFRGAPLQS